MTDTDRIAEHRAQVPVLYRLLYGRCMAGKASPRDAIKMQCLECMGYVRAEVENCDTCTCPLYRYRPYRIPSGRCVGEVSERQSTNSDNSGKSLDKG